MTTPAIGDSILIRARVIAGPHPHGGLWCHLLNEQGKTLLAKAGHAAGHVFGMPLLVPENCIVPAPTPPPKPTRRGRAVNNQGESK